MMTACPHVSRKARGLAGSYLASLAALGQGLAGSEPARVLLRLIEGGERDSEFEALLGVDSVAGWDELTDTVLSASSRGGRLLLCEAATQAGKKSMMATDWLNQIVRISEIRAEHGETTASLAKRLRPLLEQAAEEVLQDY